MLVQDRRYQTSASDDAEQYQQQQTSQEQVVSPYLYPLAIIMAPLWTIRSTGSVEWNLRYADWKVEIIEFGDSLACMLFITIRSRILGIKVEDEMDLSLADHQGHEKVSQAVDELWHEQ